MAKRVKLEVVTNPSSLVGARLWVFYGSLSHVINASIGTDIAIGATKEETAENVFDYYNTLTFPSWLTDFMAISLASNIIHFDFEPENDSNLTFNLSYTSSNVVFRRNRNTCWW